MKLWERYHNLNQRSKKYIAVGLCAGITLFGVAIPLPDTRGNGVNEEMPAQKQTSGESSVTLDLKSSMAVWDAAASEEADYKSENSVEKRGIIDRVAAGEQNAIGKATASQAEQDSGRKTEEQLALKQNLSGIADYGNTEEESNMELYEYSFEDHGSAPEAAEQQKVYQYPVELGYPVDRNYDGKQPEPFPDLMKLELDDPEEEEQKESSGEKVDEEQVSEEDEEKADEISGTDEKTLEDTEKNSETDEEDAEEVSDTSGTDKKLSEETGDTSGADEKSLEIAGQVSDIAEKNDGEKTDDIKENAMSVEGVATESEAGKQLTAADENEEKQSTEGETETSGQYTDERAEHVPDKEERIKLKAFLKNIYHQILPVEPVMTEEYLDAGQVVADTAIEIDVTTDKDLEKKLNADVESDVDLNSDTDMDTESKTNDNPKGSSGKSNTAEDSSEQNDASEDSSKKDNESEDALEKSGGSESDSEKNGTLENTSEKKDGAQDSSEKGKEDTSGKSGDSESSSKKKESSKVSSETNDADSDSSTAKEGEGGAKTDDEQSAEKSVSDAGQFLVKGLRREGSDIYTGDIQIFPSGENGFDKVRVGSEGEFSDSVTLREDVASGEVKLYFSNGKEITHTTFSYAKDTEKPSIAPDDKVYKTLKTAGGSIFCLNSSQIGFLIQDGEQSAGIKKATLVYGDRFGFVIDDFDTPSYTLPETFYGRVYYNCTDQAGNVSEAGSQYYLIEKEAPTIQVVESEQYTAPYTMGISVEDAGSIISGIDRIECTVNGEVYEPRNITETGHVRLANDIEVLSKEAFSIDFTETGHYDISLRVSDNCGNAVVLHKEIDVTEAELVAVYLAKEFNLYIDPDQIFEKEQVFSDGLALRNISDADVRITIKEINVNVKSETLDDGTVKDCTLYLIAPDTGEKILLKNGVNTDVYSYCIPVDAAEELSELNFVGELNEGSESFWEQGDVSLSIQFAFEKWEE